MRFLIRPAIGWGSWLLLHSIVIPLVYGIGRECYRKRVGRVCENEIVQPVD